MPEMTPQGAMSQMPNMLSIFGNGPATGLQAAHQIDMANQGMDLAAQGGMMANEQAGMNLDNARANVPLQDATRDVQMQQTNDQLAQLKEGIPQAVARSNAANTIDKNAGDTFDRETKKKIAIGEMATQMYEPIKDQASIPLQYLQAYKQQWKKTTGTDLPNDPAEAFQKIKMLRDWNENSGAALKEKASNQNKIDVAKIGAQKAVDVANIQTANKIELAKQRGLMAAKDPKKVEEAIVAYNLKKARGQDTTPDEDEAFRTNVALYAYGKAQSTGSKITGAINQQPTPTESAVNNLVTKSTTAPAVTTKSGYTPEQEANINHILNNPKNKGATRDQVISDMKKAGML